jgi:ribonuclease P protein component
VGDRLRKSERILKRWDFTRVQNRGYKVYGAHCLIIALPGEAPWDRVGITITKKVHKHAVRRNRFKRQVREAFRTMSGRITAPDGDGRSIDGVVIARPSALAASTSVILEDIQRTWIQVRKRCGTQNRSIARGRT